MGSNDITYRNTMERQMYFPNVRDIRQQMKHACLSEARTSNQYIAVNARIGDEYIYIGNKDNFDRKGKEIDKTKEQYLILIVAETGKDVQQLRAIRYCLISYYC